MRLCPLPASRGYWKPPPSWSSLRMDRLVIPAMLRASVFPSWPRPSCRVPFIARPELTRTAQIRQPTNQRTDLKITSAGENRVAADILITHHMSLMREKSAKIHFFDATRAEFDALVGGWGWPRFRADQVRQWVFGKMVDDPARMSNLSKFDRARLAENIYFSTAETVTQQRSTDGTSKLLLGWVGGANAETVMIPDGPRRTACVSSQVGCPVGCKFCASGIGGVKGSLTTGQIVEQIFALNKLLAPKDERITHVVF